MFLATWLLPADQQALLNQVKWVSIPAIELLILGTVLYNSMGLRTCIREESDNKTDFYDPLLIACAEAFTGRFGRMLAMVLAVFYYLLPNAKKLDLPNGFTHHKSNGIRSLIYILLGLVAVETFTVHLLAQQWSETIS